MDRIYIFPFSAFMLTIYFVNSPANNLRYEVLFRKQDNIDEPLGQVIEN